MARYSVTYSALEEASSALSSIGMRLDDDYTKLMSIEREVRGNPTLDDLDYDVLIARLAVNVRDLKEETDVAATVVQEVNEAIRLTEERVSSQVEDAVSYSVNSLTNQSSANARTTQASTRSASSGGAARTNTQASSQHGRATTSRRTAFSDAAAAAAETTGATAAATAGTMGAMGSGKTAASGTSDAALSGNSTGNKSASTAASGTPGSGSIGTMPTSGSGGGSYSGGGSGGGISASAERGSSTSPSSLSANGFSPTSSSDSNSPFQKLMDQVFGENSATAPANSLSSTMRGQMKGFSNRWAGFEQAAMQSQNASGINSMGFGEAAIAHISAGFSGLVDAGSKGFSAFSSCVNIAVSRYGSGVATVASTVTFIATSVNGALSFTPSSIAHAVNLGVTKLGAGGISPISFAQLLGK